eukprot:scaffold121663_cov55-Phaeocystis_antarctica.AAC.2
MHAMPASLLPHSVYVFAAAAGTASASVRATKVEPTGQSAALMTLEVEISYSGVTLPSRLQPAYGVPASRVTAPFSPASSKAAYTYGPSASGASSMSPDWSNAPQRGEPWKVRSQWTVPSAADSRPVTAHVA